MRARPAVRRTRTTRLLAPRIGAWGRWTLLAAVFCFLLWIVFGGAAHAGPGSGPGQAPGSRDPKAAARAIGNAGAAAAGVIARDASNAAAVPGYAGTDLPERSLDAAGMEDEARARLADPGDPGGRAGRAVIEGTLTRPGRPVAADGPEAARGEAIADDPRAPANRAGGLASGGVADCGAGVGDADAGGSCGRVTYCVGAGCETVRPEANTGFVDAVSRLNMAVELGGEEFDRRDMRFFAGQRRACHIKLFGLANCCTNSGALVGLAGCSRDEIELARERHGGNTHYLGRYCAKRTIFGVCIRRARAWCVFGSKLGRILQQQGRAQLGLGWGSCRGLTVAEVERIDFDRLDLTEFTENLMDGSMEPSVSLPGAGDTRDAMRGRIRDFYTRGQ